MDKVDNNQEQIGNVRRDMDILDKKNSRQKERKKQTNRNAHNCTRNEECL